VENFTAEGFEAVGKKVLVGANVGVLEGDEGYAECG